MVPPIPISLVVPQETPPDEDEDKPVEGTQVATLNDALNLPSIILGAGTFSNQYNSNDHLSSFTPMRLIRLALRYGIRAFDTSIYYGPSEVVLGNALSMIRDEFPRQSYQIMTKCGRFGADSFDYAPSTIRNSVEQSLKRLQTTYLDTVYLHDVEFVCTAVFPAGKTTGNHTLALGEEKATYGLSEGDEAKIHGKGDQKILDAYAELRKMKDEGIIKNIGITGYPLPTLLRLALLILHTPPYNPVDVILSYSHIALQNSTLAQFVPHLRERAKVKQIVAASPFSMGLLTPRIPPWHPAPEGLKEVVVRVRTEWNTSKNGEDGENFTDAALRYSIRRCGSDKEKLNVPLVVGVSTSAEVHDCVRVWRAVYEQMMDQERKEASEKKTDKEENALRMFRESGYLDWSWASPQAVK